MRPEDDEKDTGGRIGTGGELKYQEELEKTRKALEEEKERRRRAEEELERERRRRDRE